jgi:hypothetical protein
VAAQPECFREVRGAASPSRSPRSSTRKEPAPIGFGTILVTGGGFAIAGQIVAGTPFDPERIAERYWEVVHVDGPWQAEFRFTGR